MLDLKKLMQKKFDMFNLGRMRFFLGTEVVQDSIGISIYQIPIVLGIYVHKDPYLWLGV